MMTTRIDTDKLREKAKKHRDNPVLKKVAILNLPNTAVKADNQKIKQTSDLNSGYGAFLREYDEGADSNGSPGSQPPGS